MRTLAVSSAAALLLGAAASAGLAEAERAGRYVMKPADGGSFVRLDTETGAVSVCKKTETRWSCEEVAESGKGLRADIDRLTAENQRLKGEVKRLEEQLFSGGDAKGGRDQRAERPGGRLQLPSEEDVDRVMTYLQRMFRKFRDKLKEFEDEAQKGTPL